MYKILENGQVLKRETGNTYKLWRPIGDEFEYAYDNESNIIETRKFNIELGEWILQD